MTGLTNDLEQHEAERILESLRAGVPFPALAQKLPIGRSALLDRVGTLLQTGNGGPLLVRANYGEGKTHFLQAVTGTALLAGHVVSTISVSREAPLNNLGALFKAVTAGTRTPGSRRLGLAPLLDRLQPRAAEVLASLKDAGIPDRLRASLTAYFHVDMTYRHELLADLSGELLMVGRLKAILRDLGLDHRFPPSAFAREPIWYYRLIAELVRQAGFAGWLILIDELELIGKTAIGQRAVAYSNLSDLSTAQELPRTVVIAAVASNFYSDVLESKADAEKCPAWLSQRGREREATLARHGVDEIVRAERLPALSSEEMRTLFDAIRTIHSRAYTWDPPAAAQMEGFLDRHVHGADARLRTRIRAAVQWLDHWFQYGRDPEIIVWRVGEVDLTEQAADDEDDGPVQRKRLF